MSEKNSLSPLGRKIFLDRYSLSSGSVLHIGDNKVSDQEGAEKAGIDSDFAKAF